MLNSEEIVKNRNEEITEIARMVISTLEEAIESNIKEAVFASKAMATLSEYIGSSIISSGKSIESGIANIWQQSGLGKEVLHNPHARMNIIRKTIALVGKHGYNPIINRAEVIAEEEMVHRKSIPVCGIEKKQQLQELDLVETNESDKSWYMRKFNQSFEEFCKNAQNGKNKHLPYFKYAKIIREEVFCPLHNHRLCTIDVVRVVPHSMISQEIAKSVFELNKEGFQLLETEDEVKNLLSRPHLSAEELAHLEHIMRPGKTAHIHIVNFMPRSTSHCYEKSWADMTEQAFVTGATIHGFNYPGIGESQGRVEHKYDFIYAGLAVVNRLLDEGVHPSDIVLQGYGVTGLEIALAVNEQFSNNGKINFMVINPEYSNIFNGVVPSEFEKKLSNIVNLLSQLSFSDSSKNKLCALRGFKYNGLSYFQILNSVFDIMGHIFSKNPKLRGRNIPTERVNLVKGEVQEKQLA